MIDCNFVLLYVESPAASAVFYGGVLGRPPVESSPTFGVVCLGVRREARIMGARQRRTQSHRANGGSELGFPGGGRRGGGPHPRRLAHARDCDRPGTEHHGFRPHVRGPRTGRPSAAGVCSAGVMRRHWIVVGSAEHVRRGRAAGFIQACHGKRGPSATALSRVTASSATFAGRDVRRQGQAAGLHEHRHHQGRQRLSGGHGLGRLCAVPGAT